MKPLISFLLLCFLSVNAKAQSRASKYVSLELFTAQNAKPFGKFAGLFGETFHPGIEATYGRNISMGQNHDWFLELKLGYFYHRFVQHAIPLYLNFGYRYKITDHFSAETSLGAGYMHSIPATAQLKLGSNGEYINGKGVGRMQSVATYSVAVGYTFNPHAEKPIKIFTAYQQMVQMPFVKSYVPLLPYNIFSIGVSMNLKSK